MWKWVFADWKLGCQSLSTSWLRHKFQLNALGQGSVVRIHEIGCSVIKQHWYRNLLLAHLVGVWISVVQVPRVAKSDLGYHRIYEQQQ